MIEAEFTVPQVSAILGLPLKVINNVIDRELAGMPVVARRGRSRVVTVDGMLAIGLLASLAKQLIPGFRQAIVRKALSAGSNCTRVDEDGVMVELSKHRKRLTAGLARLRCLQAQSPAVPRRL